MDCNKDEALRARDIAEKKMETKDYAGAHKLILKAKQLSSDLENISQMLTVCSVHCSAETKLHGAEMDWYGVLQVEPTADEAAIKKQYRKLALLLHPDKNKFAGAESAFKLIGEAMRFLCDPTKRATYDMRRNAVTNNRPGLPRKPAHTRSSVRKQTTFPKDSTNNNVPQYPGMNRQQQPPLSNTAATFWTMCPFCSIRYQYYRTIMNKTLKCQSCFKSFSAHEVNMSSVGFGIGTGMNQPFYPQKNDATTQGGFGPHRVPPQGAFGTPPYGMGFQGNVPGSVPSRNTNEVKDSEIKGAQTRSHFDAEKVDELKKTACTEKQPTGSKTGKKRRKDESESSVDESSDTEESEEINMNGQFRAEENSGVSSQRPRRSTRNKKHVCYNENESEDDDTLRSPHSKRAKASGASESNCKSEMDLDQDAKCSDEESNGAAPKVKDSEPAAGISGEAAKMNSKVIEANDMKENGCETDKESSRDNSDESDDDSEDSSGQKIFICPDPEFHDFEADKTGCHFLADQVWAVYDDVHALPRYYAIIRKVLSTDFKVRITWLEPSPTTELEQAWSDAELPVACGRFSLGKTETNEEKPMFSHLMMTWERSRGKEIKIYPRKGEIWALYKRWDINWSSDPENHKEPEYEMVEILSDYFDDVGGHVIPLVKVEKCTAVYTRTLNKGSHVILHIPGGQSYRFSHRFPVYKMKGDERDNIPKDSFELDPAAFPSNWFKGSVSSENLDKGETKETVSDCHMVDSSDSISTSGERGSVCGLHKPKKSSALKDMKYEEKGNDGQMNDGVKRSTQASGDVNGLLHKKPEQADTNKQPIDENGKRNGNGASKSSESSPMVYTRNSVHASKSGVKFSPVSDSKQPKATSPPDENNKSPVDLTTGKGKPCPLSQFAAESPGRANTRRRLVNDAGNDKDVSGPKKLPDTEFHDFQDDRSIDKFRMNQIWAVYDNISGDCGVPRLYARTRKVESAAKKIHFTWLQICSDKMSKDEQLWLDEGLPISCGVFSGIAKSVESFGPEKFSHQVRDDPSWKRGKYGIYPRQGEVWAIYVSWKIGWSKLDFERHKCSIVEVVADYDAEMGVQVCHLVKVKGHRTVFKQSRRKVEINQLLEFSHQIPAFRLTSEVGGELNGCWELDPASVPPERFA